MNYKIFGRQFRRTKTVPVFVEETVHLVPAPTAEDALTMWRASFDNPGHPFFIEFDRMEWIQEPVSALEFLRRMKGET